MNKINVLYQNLNFKSGGYSVNENLETPIFASDETLADLLKKASISNYDPYKKDLKNVSSTKVVSSFQKHPRHITDGSLVSLDDTTDSLAEKNRIDSIIRKVTCKRHVKLETSEASLTKSYPECKIINTNVNITDSKIKECLANIEELNEESSRKMAKIDIKEDYLGVKLKSYLIKICAWMQEIRTTIQSGIAPLESSEDYFRRQKRASEFASRFSRNYVYQLGRQLIELRRHTQKNSSLSSSRPGSASSARFLTNACQTVLQAVQAYCNHIPTTIAMPGSTNSSSSVHGKFCELLKDTCDLCRVIKKLSCIYYDVAKSLTLVEDIETNSKSLMDLVRDTLMKKHEAEPKPVPIVKPKKKIQREKNVPPLHKMNPLESRLSMYSVAFKKNQKGNPNWKKNAEKLAKQRFSVQSRYKNPKQPCPSMIENNPPAVENKRKSIAPIKRSSIVTVSGSQLSVDPVKINEDEIVTLVETESKNLAKKQQMEVMPSSGGIRGRLEPLLKTLVAEVSAGKEEDLLGQGVCEDMLLKLRDLLDQVQRPIQKILPEKIEKKNFIQKNRISITGPKNAKLICIKDKSLFESKTEVKTLKPRFDDPSSHPKSLSVLPVLERKHSRKLVSSCSSQTMANLPKQYTINIIQYKIDFHKYTKPLMMYRKSSQVLPWVLTSKITDALFEHLMFSILNEINIDGLAEKMYRSEFETCC